MGRRGKRTMITFGEKRKLPTQCAQDGSPVRRMHTIHHVFTRQGSPLVPAANTVIATNATYANVVAKEAKQKLPKNDQTARRPEYLSQCTGVRWSTRVPLMRLQGGGVSCWGRTRLFYRPDARFPQPRSCRPFLRLRYVTASRGFNKAADRELNTTLIEHLYYSPTTCCLFICWFQPILILTSCKNSNILSNGPC